MISLWPCYRLVVFGHQQCGSVEGCGAIWSASVGSGRALVRARFCSNLIHDHIDSKGTCPAQLISDNNRQLRFQLRLVSYRNARGPREHWEQITSALQSAATASQGCLPRKPQKLWISCWILADPCSCMQSPMNR